MTALIPALLTTTFWLCPTADPQVPRGEGVWPLSPDPVVAERFDSPDSPWGAGHRGVDLIGSPGQPVLAALGGQVTFAGRLAGRGVVVVSHGPTRTTYEPVTATVAVGDLVAAGGTLGVLDTARSHCAPATCLHWGWLRGETYLDPLDLVGAGRVRLLPMLGGDLLGTPWPMSLPGEGPLDSEPQASPGDPALGLSAAAPAVPALAVTVLTAGAAGGGAVAGAALATLVTVSATSTLMPQRIDEAG